VCKVSHFSITQTPPDSPTMSRMAASKRWCCTINNPIDEDNPATWLVEYVDYYYFAPELGDNGTPHLQGFFQLKNPMRLTGLKKLHPRAHFEKMRGTMEENLIYCSKQQLEDAPTAMEYGELPDDRASAREGGEREQKRWKRVHQLAADGDIEGFVDEFPAESFLHLDKFETWHARRKPKPLPLLHTVRHQYFWGPPGTGKSLRARTENPEAYIKDNTKWWQGYAGESTVIIDDIDPHVLKSQTVQALKTWFDIYPFPAEIKGGTLGLIRPALFVVTSNFPLEELCQGEPHLLGAMQRRFEVTHFNEGTVFQTMAAAQEQQYPDHFF